MRTALPFVVFLACGGVAVEPAPGVSAPNANPTCALPDVDQLATSAGNESILQLAFHGTDILFTTSGINDTLAIVSKAGGPTTVTSAPCNRFALDGDVAFCMQGTTLSRAPLDGSPSTALAADLPFDAWNATLVAGGGQLYVTDTHTIWVVDETTGARDAIASAPAIWLDGFDDGTLYWRSNSGGYGAPSFAINATTANVTTTLTTVAWEVRPLKLTPASIYFMAYDPSAAIDPNKSPENLYTLPRAGGDVIPVIEEISQWSDFAVYDGTIIATRLQDGAIVFDFEGRELGRAHPTNRMDMADADGDYVYSVTNGDYGAWISRACRYPE